MADKLKYNPFTGELDITTTSTPNLTVLLVEPTSSHNYASGYTFGQDVLWGDRIYKCIGDGVWKELVSGDV